MKLGNERANPISLDHPPFLRRGLASGIIYVLFNPQEIMVTISGYKKRINAEGKEFCTLSLMGGIEFVRSSKTGQFYATAWKSSITSTFPEAICQTLIGTNLPGVVEKVECEPYAYQVGEGKETIMLSHKFRFNPEPNCPTLEEAVFSPEPELSMA